MITMELILDFIIKIVIIVNYGPSGKWRTAIFFLAMYKKEHTMT